jgi:di/tricarboxylate transporter
MTHDQIVIVAILLATIAMFLWGRWRHDMVAVGALLACVATGLVPTGAAFAGFAHPAVITVACVLVLSHALQTSGAIDTLAQRILPSKAGPMLMIGGLAAIAAFLSAFMNNVGALALLMPLAIQIAAKQELPAGRVLMPLAFGSILGGMTTLIGTPPNLIVAAFRAERMGGSGFGMFDFTPVGAAIAVAGLAFITLVGWRLVPARQPSGAEGFDVAAYLTEAHVPDKAKAVGMSLGEVEQALDEADVQVIGIVRNDVRMPAPHSSQRVHAGDIVVLEADPEALASALTSLGLQLEEAVATKDGDKDDAPDPKSQRSNGDKREGPARTSRRKAAGESSRKQNDANEAATKGGEEKPSDEIKLVELAVLPGSRLAGRSATDIRLRTRFGINLLAVSRQGQRSKSRLRSLALRAGDVLLMQGAPESIAEFAGDFGCVPLAERALRLPNRRQILIATAIMLGAISGAAFGVVPAAVSFAAGVLAAMVTRVVPLRAVYTAIDWPVIVLLGALIPVAGAMASTGAAELIAKTLLNNVAQGHSVVALALILVVTMTLSDFVNNAATAAVMCPIAMGIAAGLGASTDPFLMAVAVGASCAFLTPIGHQNNTLILGPGGLRFGDYWRFGLPLELIVVVFGVPMILVVWPL